jgi:hypothetical protein
MRLCVCVCVCMYVYIYIYMHSVHSVCMRVSAAGCDALAARKPLSLTGSKSKAKQEKSDMAYAYPWNCRIHAYTHLSSLWTLLLMLLSLDCDDLVQK